MENNENNKEVKADELEETLEENEAGLQKLGGRKKLVKRFGQQDYELMEPFEWCGVTYTALHMDFASMTGEDIEALEDELTAMGGNNADPTKSRRYQKLLAARAAGVPSDMLGKLPAADYNAITNGAKAFLIVTG